MIDVGITSVILCKQPVLLNPVPYKESSQFSKNSMFVPELQRICQKTVAGPADPTRRQALLSYLLVGL